jgi:hypothetical protein
MTETATLETGLGDGSADGGGPSAPPEPAIGDLGLAALAGALGVAGALLAAHVGFTGITAPDGLALGLASPEGPSWLPAAIGTLAVVAAALVLAPAATGRRTPRGPAVALALLAVLGGALLAGRGGDGADAAGAVLAALVVPAVTGAAVRRRTGRPLGVVPASCRLLGALVAGALAVAAGAGIAVAAAPDRPAPMAAEEVAATWEAVVRAGAVDVRMERTVTRVAQAPERSRTTGTMDVGTGRADLVTATAGGRHADTARWNPADAALHVAPEPAARLHAALQGVGTWRRDGQVLVGRVDVRRLAGLHAAGVGWREAAWVRWNSDPERATWHTDARLHLDDDGWPVRLEVQERLHGEDGDLVVDVDLRIARPDAGEPVARR